MVSHRVWLWKCWNFMYIWRVYEAGSLSESCLWRVDRFFIHFFSVCSSRSVCVCSWESSESSLFVPMKLCTSHTHTHPRAAQYTHIQSVLGDFTVTHTKHVAHWMVLVFNTRFDVLVIETHCVLRLLDKVLWSWRCEPVSFLYAAMEKLDLLGLSGVGLSKVFIFVLFYQGLITFLHNIYIVKVKYSYMEH